MNLLPLDILETICRFSGFYGKTNLSTCSKYLNVQSKNHGMLNIMALDVKLSTHNFEKYYKYTNPRCINRIIKKHKKLSDNIFVTNDFVFHCGNSIIVECDGKIISEYKPTDGEEIYSFDYMDSHKLLVVNTFENNFIFFDLIDGRIIKQIKYPENLVIKYHAGDNQYFKSISNPNEHSFELYLITANTEHKIYNDNVYRTDFIGSWNNRLVIHSYFSASDSVGHIKGFNILDSNKLELFFSTNWSHCTNTKFLLRYKKNYMYYNVFYPGLVWKEEKYLECDGKQITYFKRFEKFSYGCYGFKIYERKNKLCIQYDDNYSMEIIITDKYKNNSLFCYKNVISFHVQNDEHVYSISP